MLSENLPVTTSNNAIGSVVNNCNSLMCFVLKFQLKRFSVMCLSDYPGVSSASFLLSNGFMATELPRRALEERQATKIQDTIDTKIRLKQRYD